MACVLLASLSFTVSLPFLWDVDHFSIADSALFPPLAQAPLWLSSTLPAQESPEPLKLSEGGGLCKA